MNTFFYIIIIQGKNILLLTFLLMFIQVPGFSNNSIDRNSTKTSLRKKDQKIPGIHDQLKVFYPLDNTAEYYVTVCTDVPVNNNPGCVFKKGETGHVFLILSKRDLPSGKIINRSFGFYPRVPVTFLFKRVRSRILDNSNREYDASLEVKLTNEVFELLLTQCGELAKKKYDLKKFNCYDYVLQIFNSLPGFEALPDTKVKFPFILGRGGSPCGLYSTLKKLLANGSALAPFIKFGSFKSPYSHSHENQIASSY